MNLLVNILLFFLLFLSVLSHAEDCTLGEKYYKEAEVAGDLETQEHLLRKSIEVCPTFRGWYLLGRVHQREGQKEQALEAFQTALKMKGTREEFALAKGRIGEIRGDKGDLAEAATELRTAVEAHPKPPTWMTARLRGLELRLSTSLVSAKDITRSLGDRVRDSNDKKFLVQPTVHLHIHFAYDREDLDERGKRQVEELGKALADSSLGGYSFLLIGHTDSRGSDAYNQELSERRARTVSEEISRAIPWLKTRLRTEGRGQRELLYKGNTEQDHQLNRRVVVQVVK